MVASLRAHCLSNPSLIAIVDDDRAVREALCDLFQVEGLAARDFESAAAFLNSARNEEFGCLITDVRMPGMDGLALQQHLRQSGSSIPIIFITSSTNDATREMALRGGASAWFSKPVTDAELLAAVRSSLEPDGTHRPEA